MGTVAYHGRNTGKKIKAMKIVKQALDIVHHHTGVNPLQVTHLFPTIQYNLFQKPNGPRFQYPIGHISMHLSRNHRRLLHKIY